MRITNVALPPLSVFGYSVADKYLSFVLKASKIMFVRLSELRLRAKWSYFKTEIANTKKSLQQKLDDPTFTNLQNIFINKEKSVLKYKHTQIMNLKQPISRASHNNL